MYGSPLLKHRHEIDGLLLRGGGEAAEIEAREGVDGLRDDGAGHLVDAGERAPHIAVGAVHTA